ncbi:MAG: SusC/RagA family TonB-linked outer membrane protein [Chitinophagaceae bacterium]|nr:SusC/RagA family TonB-linked outer membrane protein [Chitinophagaceae bacterium]
MKSALLRVLLFSTCFLIALATWSQTQRVTGTVSSAEDQKPLQGVSVTIKGKTTGTQTTADGKFALDAAPGDILVFTSVSFTSQERKLGNETTISISLEPLVAKMDEVVVVGYGTQKRKEFAGAAQTVNQLTFKHSPSSNLGTALQGTVPGLLVQQTTGQPGSTPNIVFRGGTTFTGGGAPMVILDGAYVPSLYGIDMNDVESIDVLKDAASTAIYGARAANGVILITTKKGKKGKTQVQYTVRSTTNGIRSVADRYLNAEDYIRMNRLGLRNRYLADSLGGGNYASDRGQLNGNWGWAFGATFGNAEGLYTTQRLNDNNRKYLNQNGWKLLVDPNPFFPSVMDSILYKEISAKEREDMIMNNTSTTEHSFSFSGANDMGAFALNVNTLKDNGTIIGSWLKRLNMNFNGTLNVGNKTKINLNTSAYNVDQAVPYTEPGVAGSTGATGGLLQRFLGVAPTVRYYNDTSGKIIPGPNDVTLGNPLYWSKLYVNSTNEQRFSGGLNIEYTILPYLKFLAGGNGFLRYGNNNFFTKSYQTGSGGAMNNDRRASFSNYRDIQYTANAMLQFNRSFGEHNLTVLGGAEYFEYKRYVFSGFAQGAPTDVIPWLTASNVPTVINGVINYPAGASSNFSGWERIASLIGRANYTFKDRYFLTGVIRYDGSSRLDASNHYGVFPGVSGGWNLHNENFYRNSNLPKYVSSIKPRISYGVNGNLTSLGYYDAAQVYSNAGVYNGLGGTYAPSYINPDLRWERSNSLNFGADLGFLRNKIMVNADYFIRNVYDKIASLPISAQTGFTSYTTNLAQLRNKGFELTVNAKVLEPYRNKQFSLDIGASFYTVKNFAVKLPYNGLPGNRQGTFEVWDPKNPGQKIQVGGLIEGQRVGYDEVWAPMWAGVYTTQAQIDADAAVYMAYLPYTNKKYKQLGDARWHQVYKNDTIDVRQFVYVGRTTPKGSGSFFFNAGYKGIQLYTAFDYAYGFVILNNENLRGLSQVQGSQNGTKDILNTWSPANPNATMPSFYWANQGRNYATDASGNNPPANMWEKGDYLMLREVTLSYTVPQEILRKTVKNALRGVNVFVTGSNLVYFTKYGGTFPEVGGFDNGRYPLPRRLTLGAQITL